MREIKFRAKRIDNGKWVYGSYVKYSESECYIHGDYIDKNEVWKCNNNTTGQFTGLYDKNGKEIYEEDIVKDNEKKCLISFGKIGFGKKWNGLTGFWLDELYTIDEDDNIYMEFEETIDFKNLEVIGNLYDKRNKFNKGGKTKCH